MQNLKIFFVYKVRFYGGSQALHQYLFLFLSAGLDTGVSGKGLLPD